MGFGVLKRSIAMLKALRGSRIIGLVIGVSILLLLPPCEQRSESKQFEF